MELSFSVIHPAVPAKVPKLDGQALSLMDVKSLTTNCLDIEEGVRFRMHTFLRDETSWEAINLSQTFSEEIMVRY